MLKEHFGNAVITRAHYAILMVEAGYVSDKNEAFDKFLNPGCPCYIPRMKVSVTEAVKIILDANGKPVLAHPLLYHLSDEELNSLVNLLKENGLQGIEAIYSSNTGNDEARMKSLADKYNLFITGGTDFHGIAKPSLDLGTGYGNIKIPEELLNNII
jgi:predicted metal-dependent phosphoesterase TrpH